MRGAQIMARVEPELKAAFSKKAKQYGLPQSGVLAMLMRAFAQWRISPDITANAADNERTPALQKEHRKALKELERGETMSLETVMSRRWITA